MHNIQRDGGSKQPATRFRHTIARVIVRCRKTESRCGLGLRIVKMEATCTHLLVTKLVSILAVSYLTRSRQDTSVLGKIPSFQVPHQL